MFVQEIERDTERLRQMITMFREMLLQYFSAEILHISSPHTNTSVFTDNNLLSFRKHFLLQKRD